MLKIVDEYTIEAIHALSPKNAEFMVSGDELKWLSPDIPQPKISLIKTKAAELRSLGEVQKLISSLQEACDIKSQEAKKVIAGINVSAEQLARYEGKLELAKRYKQDGSTAKLLSFEAKATGVTVDALATSIIKNGAAYKSSLLMFNSLIEGFRINVKTMIINGDSIGSTSAIEKFSNLDVTKMETDLASVFI